MRILELQNSPSQNIFNDTVVTEITRPLDRMRVAFLKITLKNSLLRKVYRDRALRLGLNFTLLSALYLLISLRWSIVLLVIGPLILGYPHLVASYRFLQKPGIILRKRWSSASVFRFFVFLTVVSLCVRFLIPLLTPMSKLPYGTWEILLSLSALTLVNLNLKSIRHILVIILTVVSIGLILNLAWFNPLAFVGIALIFHNWVGFGHWFLASKDFKTRAVVVMSTLLFAVIHLVVFAGFLDPWIAISDFKFFPTQSFEVSGWTLASWSLDPKMWDRALVLYAFGLSLHYFVWLRAIPQSLDQNIVPNSFRRSLELLRSDCGTKTTAILLLAALLVFSMWFFISIAGQIYFGVAMLHGWLEFTFLLVAFYSGVLNIDRASTGSIE